MFELTRCDQVSLRASCAFIISMTTSDRFYFLHKYYIKPTNVVKYSCVNITQKCNSSPFTVVDSRILRPTPNPRGGTKLLFDEFRQKNCMKTKDIGPSWGCVPCVALHAPLFYNVSLFYATVTSVLEQVQIVHTS